MDHLFRGFTCLLLALFIHATSVNAELLKVDPSLEAVGLNGKTYYVSPDGNDRNSGTRESSPLRTIQAAAFEAEPGDTVLVREGIYSDLGGQEYVLYFNGGGTEENWIRFANYPGEKPVIEIEGRGGILLSGASYVLVEGFTIRANNEEVDHEEAVEFAKVFQNDDYSDLRLFTTGITVSLEGSRYPHHIILRGNTVSGCNGNGIAVKRADYVLVERNTTFENAFYSPWGTSGISVWSSWNLDDNVNTYRTVLRGNVSYRNENRVIFWMLGRITDGNGIIIDALKNVQSDLVGDGYDVPYSGKILIANNVCYENGGRGINVFQSENIDIVNNTLYLNSSHPEMQGEIGLGAANDIRIYNNIAYEREDSVSVSEWSESGANYGSYDIEHLMTRFGEENADVYIGSREIKGDPKFVDAASGDFRLSSGSRAIDGGTDDLFYPVDIAGTERPAGRRVDLGAYEQ